MTSFSMFAVFFAGAYAANCTTLNLLQTACTCGGFTADNCGATAGTEWCKGNTQGTYTASVQITTDGEATCTTKANCATLDGSAASTTTDCFCDSTVSGTAYTSFCYKDSFCQTSTTTSFAPTNRGYCLRSSHANLQNCMTVTTGTGSNSVVPFFACRCAEKTVGAGQNCASINSATPAVGTTAAAAVLAVNLGVAGGTCAAADGSAACGAAGWCTVKNSQTGGAAAVNSGDVAAAATDYCIVPSVASGGNQGTQLFGNSGTSLILGLPVVKIAAFGGISGAWTQAKLVTAMATGNACVAYKVNGLNSLCRAVGVTTATAYDYYCSGGTYYSGLTTSPPAANSITTYCVPLGSFAASSSAGTVIIENEVCANQAGAAANTNPCACVAMSGALIARQKLEVYGGERAQPASKFCTARGATPAITFEGVPTVSTAAIGECYLTSDSTIAASSLANNGTVFTAAHVDTSAGGGVGVACKCGTKVCGAGRACMNSTTAGWTGKAGGTPQDECISAWTSTHQGACGEYRGNGSLTIYSANTGLMSDNGHNEACYCDDAHSVICGAGRYCLNSTKSTFAYAAECLGAALTGCSNYTGYTSATEACECTTSVTCGAGRYCINATSFTTATTAPAECLASQISACVNFTHALGANSNACTCGTDTCAAGEYCDSNTTCTTGGSPTSAPTSGSGSAAGYEKPALAFLTIMSIVLSVLY